MTNKENWKAYLDVASMTHVGMRRGNNQDSFTVSLAGDMQSWQKSGHLFVVADGMGAHAAGELASKIAVEKIPHLYRKYSDVSPPEALKKSVIDANAEIHRRGQANEEFLNMGTTCSTLCLLPHGAVAAHVGDSRVYRLRGARFEQLTFDHSLVWEMREANRRNGDASADVDNVPKNVITRSLGPFPDVNVDLEGPFPLRVGDTFLLCSDGLTGQVEDDELGPILANLSPQDAAKVLIDLSNLRGGPDNITVIIVRVLSSEMTTEEATDAPLVIGGRKEPATVTILIWVLFVAFLVTAGLVGFAMNNYVVAGIFGLLSLGCLARNLFKLFGPGSSKVVGAGKRFGKGPYVKIDASKNEAVLKGLHSVLADLRRAAVEEEWNVDLAIFDKQINKAIAYRESGKQNKTIRAYAKALTDLMDQIRGTD